MGFLSLLILCDCKLLPSFFSKKFFYYHDDIVTFCFEIGNPIESMSA